MCPKRGQFRGTVLPTVHNVFVSVYACRVFEITGMDQQLGNGHRFAVRVRPGKVSQVRGHGKSAVLMITHGPAFLVDVGGGGVLLVVRVLEANDTAGAVLVG